MPEKRSSGGSPAGPSVPLRICYFGTYERDYPRNRVMIEGLRACGAEVVECHEEVWGLTQIKLKDYFRATSLVRLVVKYLAACVRLLVRHTRVGPYDALVIGFNGHLDVFLARLLTWWRRRPLVFNPLTSIYNTLVEDKGFYPEGSLPARLCILVEKMIYQLSDRIVLDTAAHLDYYRERFGVAAGKLAVVPVGADDRVFFLNGAPPPNSRFRVLYYGKYLPLHGVDHILQAAKHLESHADIEFLMIGKGQFAGRAKEIFRKMLAREVPNITFIDWVDYEELPRFISGSDLCLGIFGGTTKACMVIPNKVYQAMAMGKPLITGDSPAAREVFVDGETALLTPMRDSQGLARAILRVKEDPGLREKLGAGALALFREHYTVAKIGQRFLGVIEGAIAERARRSTAAAGVGE